MKKDTKKGMGGYLKPRKQQGGMMIEPSNEINFNSPNNMAKSGGLKGGQKKLDKDGDGKISGKDFKMMKKGGAKRANRLLTKSRTIMDNAVTLYDKGKTNKESSSATAQEFGQDQQIRSKRKEKRSKKIKERSEKVAKRKGLTYTGSEEIGVYMKKGGSKKR
tara:strand:- start:424 stop:909 length:486 start_codon:yes stop_codon:yes gene_type:complete